MKGKVIKVLIGEIAITHAPNILETVLGSCIGLVLFDSEVKLAGMAHILLPFSRENEERSPAKYANHAVPNLIGAMEHHGAKQLRMKAKLAGGARMFDTGGLKNSSDIGAHNIRSIREILREYKIPLLKDDVGGTWGRKALFTVQTNVMEVQAFDPISMPVKLTF